MVVYITQRGNYKKGKLSPDRIKSLEEIGFIWEKFEELFEKGFQETLLYKESIGNPNASHIYETPEGYQLGTWQNTQRFNYRNGKLSPERVKRLEDIGFKWEIHEKKLEEQFEKGFQETLLYKEKNGTPNATYYYKTPEGYPLGIWQSRQRKNYRKGILSPERIKRFEEIGFKWGK